jgi:hypothetical protein
VIYIEYYMNFYENSKMTVSIEQPDSQAALTLTIRGSSTGQIAQMLTEAKAYLASHDVVLEGITGAFNKLVRGLGYGSINTVMASSILSRRTD